MLKLRGGGCLNPARRYSSCGGVAGGGFLSECLLRQFRGVELPSSVRSSSILGGDLEKAAIFSSIRRCFRGIEPPPRWPDCFSRESLLLGSSRFEKSELSSHGVEPPSLRSSLLLGGRSRSRRGLFERPFSSLTIRRCFSSTPEVATAPVVVDEATRVRARSSLSSPWLMVPPRLLSNEEAEAEAEAGAAFGDDYFYFYNVSEKKMVKMKRNNKIRLPWQRDILSANEAICVGSSHGWLAFLHPHNCSLFLFNPLLLLSSSSEFPYLPLPPVETLPSVVSSVRRRHKDDRDSSSIVTEYSVPWEKPVSSQELNSGDFVSKLSLSSAPFPFLSKYGHQKDIIVMAILGYKHRKLAFCRLGDRAWTALDSRLSAYDQLVYISKDQLFYTLSTGEALESWDLRDPASPKSILITNFEPPRMQPTMDEQQQRYRTRGWSHRTRYLVESCSGDLMMVLRYSFPYFDDQGHKIYDSRAYKSVAFDVYKLDFDSVANKNKKKKKKKWAYVTSLGDEALFVGQKDCFSLPATNFPGLSKNSIYFTPDCWLGTADYGGQDMGIFSLEDGSITPFFHSDSKKNLPPPVWIIPQL